MVLRLLGLMRIEIVPEFDACYPGRQPAEVVVKFEGAGERKAGVDDVPWLSPQTVHARLQVVASTRADERAASDLAASLQSLEAAPNLGPFFDALAPFAADSAP